MGEENQRRNQDEKKKSVTDAGDEGPVSSLSQEAWHRGRENQEEGRLCARKSGQRTRRK